MGGQAPPTTGTTLADPDVPTVGTEAVASVLPPPAEFERGQRIDQFTIIGRVGVGAMGTVYRAHDRALGRDVAVKLIRRDLVDRPSMRVAFESEARAMARVRHPNVVMIHAFGEVQHQPYFVMEYVRGVSVATWRDARGRVDVAETLAILDPFCRGVEAIHASGTLHRDLKPGNAILESSGRVAVTDFGLAHSVTEHVQSACPAYGTPGYLAPEIAREEPIAPSLASRADVYSLAVIAFELLTGRQPFRGESIPALLEQHAFAPPPRPSSINPALPAAFDEVLLRALAKSPASRTPSAECLRRELWSAHEGTTTARGLRVLVVDDETSASTAICSLVRDEFPGSEVVTASRTSAALSIAFDAPPDVVIADLQMPDGGAMALTERLRQHTSTATVPIIVVTGHGGSAEWAALRQRGADRFLVKPVDFDALAAIIRAVVPDRSAPS